MAVENEQEQEMRNDVLNKIQDLENRNARSCIKWAETKKKT